MSRTYRQDQAIEDSMIHDRIYDILSQKAALGLGDDYGGWAKGSTVPKAKYIANLMKKGYTEKEAEEMRKKLLAKKRAKNKGVTKEKAVKKGAKKATRKKSEWIKFLQRKDNKGLTMAQKAAKYKRHKKLINAYNKKH